MDSTIKQEIEQNRERLKTLRDQIRLKIHLGGMDAKDAFRSIETEAEKLANDVSHATRQKLDELIARLSTLLAPLD